MKTVFPKRRVLLYLTLFGCAIGFLVILQFSGDSRSTATGDVVNPRDILQRKAVEQEELKPKVNEVVVQSEDFVDEKEEKKESLEVVDDTFKKNEIESENLNVNQAVEENDALKEVIEPPDNDDGTV